MARTCDPIAGKVGRGGYLGLLAIQSRQLQMSELWAQWESG